MAYFVFHQTEKYEGRDLSEFATKVELETFLNANAANPDFTFTIIEGKKIEARPVEVVKQYRLKD